MSYESWSQQLGNTTLTLLPLQPQNQAFKLTVCHKSISSTQKRKISVFHKYLAKYMYMYMYLLMYSLLFSHTIMLPVVEVGCLQHSNVQTHAMKTFVVNNARYCTTSFLLFLYHPIHLRAANVLMEVVIASQLPHWHLQRLYNN